MSEMEFTGAKFYKQLGEHKLVGSRCRKDGQLYCPPRPLCSRDHQADMESVEMSGFGKLSAFTVVHVAPSAMLAAGYDRKNPYCVGIVELAEGPSVSAQILGVDVSHPEQIRIGMPLHVTFVERGEGQARQTFLAFEPVH